MAVAAVLREADEFSLFEHRALLAATQRRLASRGLSMRQAFHAFNSSRTGDLPAHRSLEFRGAPSRPLPQALVVLALHPAGMMNCSELFSALRWLGIHPDVSLVHATIKRLDADEDGLVTCDEFVAGFAAGDPTADTSALATFVPGQQELVIPLQQIPELYKSATDSGAASRRPVVSLSSSELAQYAATLRPCMSTQPVWPTTAAARADAGTAGLCFVEPSSTLARTAVASSSSLVVPVGHYASAEPQGGGRMSLQSTTKIIELRSMHASASKAQLQAALEQVMPPPARFQMVWTASAGSEPFTIWAAVPPTQDFVAIGMVATATGPSQRPPTDVLRCVPKKWTRRTPAAELVHDRNEGSVWRSAHGLLHASKGRHPPQVHELIREEFGLSEFGL